MLRPLLRSVASIAMLAAVSCSSSSSVPFDGGVTQEAVTPTNVTWCPTATPPAGCKAVSVCGVCIQQPPGELRRTTDTKEYAGTGAVDVACLQKDFKVAGLGTSKKIKMHGYAKIFANGPDSLNLKIEVFKEGANGALGEKVGETTTEKANADKVTLPTCATAPCTLTEKILKSGTEVTRTLYPYEIADIPSETVLIVRTSGVSTSDGWFSLYDYGAAALDAVKCTITDPLKKTSCIDSDGAFAFNVRALGNDDYASILKAAYSRAPEGGEGAIAGEVHDCGDVRLSNATVDVEPKSRLNLFYLSEVEDDPLPDSARKGTGRLGLYAVGGFKPGSYTVAAAGKLGTEVLGLGSYQVQVFPDSVSVFTFRGRRPWQK